MFGSTYGLFTYGFGGMHAVIICNDDCRYFAESQKGSIGTSRILA